MKKILVLLLAMTSPAIAEGYECEMFESEIENSLLHLSLSEGFFMIKDEKFITLGCGTGISGVCGISEKTNEDVFLQKSEDNMVYLVNGVEYYHVCDSQ
tara:strand:- start:11619 stop:11915 length:297 start_codon:yes stop_codon:yes gene_type:complete